MTLSPDGAQKSKNGLSERAGIDFLTGKSWASVQSMEFSSITYWKVNNYSVIVLRIVPLRPILVL